MEKSALISYLEFTLSNQDVTRPKPDPEILLPKPWNAWGMSPVRGGRCRG